MKMIFLDYLYALPNATTGLDDILVETASAVPSLMPLVFLFIWGVVLLGGANLQLRRLGTADYALWSTIASLCVFLVALLASVISGLINVTWLVIVFILTVISGVWLFLERKQSEL